MPPQHWAPHSIDVAGHDGAGDGVEVGVGPAEGVQGGADDQGGISHPAGDDHLRAGGQRVGDRTRAQVRVGGDDGGVRRQGLSRVEIDEALTRRR